MVRKTTILLLSFLLIAFAALVTMSQETSGNDKQEAEQRRRQGDAAVGEGNYKDARRHYEASLKIFERLRDKKGIADTSSDLGRAYNGLGEYEKALELLHAALARHQELGDEAGRGWDLTRISAVELNRGRYRNALDTAERALKIHEALGDQKGLAEALRNIGGAHRNMGDHKKALVDLEMSLKTAEAIGDRRAVAATLNSIGVAHQELGNYAQALEYYQKSLQMHEGIGEQKGVAACLNNIGLVHRELGDYAQAAAYHQRSFEIKKKIGDKRGTGTSLHNIGEVDSSLGHYADALQHHQQALKIFEELGAKREWAQSLSTLGFVYSHLGNHVQALAYFEKSLKLREEIGDKNGMAQSLHGMANLHARLGHNLDALRYHERALKLKEEIGNQRIVSISLHDIGSLHAGLGHYDQAIDYYQKSLKLRQDIGDRSGVAQILSSMGSAYYKKKALPEADRYLSDAITLSEQIGHRNILSASLYRKGLVLRDMGKTEAAINLMKEATDIIEQLRRHIPLAEQRAGFLQEKLDVYEDLIDLLFKSNRSADVFHYAERAKARAFLDLLTEARAELRKKIRSELRERERVTLARLLTQQRLFQDAAAKKAQDEKRLAELREQVSQAEREHEDVKLEIRRASPEYAAIKYPAPIGLEQARALLDARDVLLEYVLGNNGSFLLAVTRDDFRVYLLPNREALESKAEAFTKLLAQLPSESGTLAYIKAAYNLYELLVQPAARQIEGKRSIIVVPDGALALLPFPALLTEKSKLMGEIPLQSLPYLVKAYDISYIQSASVLGKIKKAERHGPWARTLVGFAPIHFLDGAQLNAGIDDIYRSGVRLGNLPYTRKELEWIKAFYRDNETMLYLENAATEEKVKDGALKNYRYVHFATHGIIHPDRPEFSSIILRTEGREDGYLQLAEVLNLELDADLVVLSACQSGKGKQMNGEGLIGLTRGFMYAGAASVLASLWNVQDRPTAHLMQAFYKNLENVTKSEALRRAQLEFIKGARAELTYYSHPYYWSAFVLVGAQ